MPISLSSASAATFAGPAGAAAAGRRAERALALAAAGWCAVAAGGQLIFASYVIALYGRSAAAGRFDAWNKAMAQGYVPGDTPRNLAMGLHLAVAVLLLAGGALQLVPGLRRRAPAFHRWNGRVFVVGALLAAVGGLQMMATRHPVGDFAQHLAIGLNAAAMLACAGQAWRHARARRFEAHRRWALRLYLVVGGVWFFRIGLSAWLVLNHGPAGFDPRTFTGPAITVLTFGQTLMPLAVLEAYLRVRAAGGPGARLAMAAALAALAVLTALGVAAATMILWRPLM